MSSPTEFDLIKMFSRQLGRPQRAKLGIGDDMAILPTGDDDAWLMATDILVEGIHFDRRWSSLEDVGWKALAVNISDVAAMGGLPRFATIALGLPGPTDAPGIFQGLHSCASEYGVEIVGGDTVRAPQLIINATIIGVPAGIPPVTRAGARPGDLVCVTGWLGAAGAGIEALQRGIPASPGTAAAQAIASHRRPTPRVQAGRILARSGATAMMDISDGLAGDAAHIATASQVAIILEKNKIPIHPAVTALAREWGMDPFTFAMESGEDFELLACLAPADAKKAAMELERLGLPLTVVGRCESGQGVWLHGDGKEEPVPLTPAGFDHFR